MLEQGVNILSDEVLSVADAICFTSNGVVKSNGRLTMGAGIAKSFADKFPSTPMYFGRKVEKFGNKVHLMGSVGGAPPILSFPTKYHWRDTSDVQLIEKSCKELKEYADKNDWKNIYLPRPGIGLGGLKWAEVKPILEKHFDDRFIVCYL